LLCKLVNYTTLAELLDLPFLHRTIQLHKHTHTEGRKRKRNNEQLIPSYPRSYNFLCAPPSDFHFLIFVLCYQMENKNLFKIGVTSKLPATDNLNISLFGDNPIISRLMRYGCSSGCRIFRRKLPSFCSSILYNCTSA
jgi:hypothetical protein